MFPVILLPISSARTSTAVFAIAGKGGHFVWAHAEVDGNLPAISSRSDDWSRHQRE